MQLTATKPGSVVIACLILTFAGFFGAQTASNANAKQPRAHQKHFASCRTPNKEATTSNQVPPDYPEAARGQGPATVLVQVTIGPNGNLLIAKVLKSSNNEFLDKAALSAARKSSYTPRIVNCKRVTGTYIFNSQFDPNQ